MSESSEEITEPAPKCPKCEQPMVRRTARRGANAGRGFWGCSEFPRCRGIVSDQPAASTSDEGDASVEESRAGDDADEATSSDVAGKAEGLLTKVVKAVDKGRRWYLESDEPDASGRWDEDHRQKVLAYVYNRDDGRCGLCAGEMKLQAVHLEHIVPKVFAVFDIRKGGKAEPGTYYKSRLHRACDLERRGLARLSTTEGVGRKRFVLRPLLGDQNRSLVDLYNEGGTVGRAYVLFWRSVFERRVPDSIDRIESLSGMRLGQGNWTQNFSDDLPQALTEAYAEAAG